MAKYPITISLVDIDPKTPLHSTFVRAFASRKLANGAILQLKPGFYSVKPIVAGDELIVNGKSVYVVKIRAASPGQNPGVYVEFDTTQFAGEYNAALMRAVSVVYGMSFLQIAGGSTSTSAPVVSQLPASAPAVTTTPVDFAWDVQQFGSAAVKIALAVGAIVIIVVAAQYLKK